MQQGWIEGTATERPVSLARRLFTGPLAVALLSIAAMGGANQDQRSFRVESLKERREKYVVMQRWETSCAAAAIATVLTYGFHDPVSERYAASKMLENTDPTKVRARGGFSLLDMKKFVEARGYSGDAYQYLTVEDLKAFRAPIVPLQLYGYNHYVVVNAVGDGDVLLADPAWGNRVMSLPRFQEVWLNGLAFVLTPKKRTAS